MDQTVCAYLIFLPFVLVIVVSWSTVHFFVRVHCSTQNNQQHANNADSKHDREDQCQTGWRIRTRRIVECLFVHWTHFFTTCQLVRWSVEAKSSSSEKGKMQFLLTEESCARTSVLQEECQDCLWLIQYLQWLVIHLHHTEMRDHQCQSHLPFLKTVSQNQCHFEGHPHICTGV